MNDYTTNNRQKTRLLERWSGGIVQAAQSGALDGGKPITIHSVELVEGPRCGALEIHAGLDTARLLAVLSRGDCALHRQFIPWRFAGEPSVYLTSRYVRLEAAWPDQMAENDIKLSDIGQYPKNGGRWIAGKSEIGATVTLSISDKVPHYLFGGWTGSGKTWAMRSAIAQLSCDEMNRFILVDGKYGDGLGCLSHIHGLIGPVASDVESARAALAYAVKEMIHRYQTEDRAGRIIVAIDEVQEFTGRSGDALVTEMVSRLVRQGRGAGVHVFVGTQNPTAEIFSDLTIRRNLPGRVALRTENAKASEVVIGGATPRADRLLGAGDCYVVTPSACHRAQLAYIPSADLERMNTSPTDLDTWPDADAESTAGQEPAPRYEYRGDELAIALVAAHNNQGRPALVKALEADGCRRPGVEKATRLLGLGRDMHAWLSVHDWCLSVCHDDAHPAGYEIDATGRVVSVPGCQTDRQEGTDA